MYVVISKKYPGDVILAEDTNQLMDDLEAIVNGTKAFNQLSTNDTTVVLNLNADMLDGAHKSTDNTFASTSDNLIPTEKAIKEYINNTLEIDDVVFYKGQIDCSTNPDYPAANAGWVYIVSSTGKIGGPSGLDVQTDGFLICKVDDSPSGDQVAVGDNWTSVKINTGDLTTSTGLTVIGGDAAIIGSGTRIGIATGYYLPTTGDQTNWDNSYTTITTAGNFTTSTGLAITGGLSSVLGLGTRIGISAGYYLPTSADHNNWDSAYSAINTAGNFTTSTGLEVTGGTDSVLGSGVLLRIASGYYLPTTLDKNKWDAASGITIGNLTTSTGLEVTGGTGAIIGSGAVIGISSGYYLPNSSDKSVWDGKQDALSFGDLESSTGLVVSGNVGAVVGSGTTIGIASGYYLPTTSDESTWDGKQDALSFGDLTTSTGLKIASGTGSVIGTGTKITIDSGYYLPTDADKVKWDGGTVLTSTGNLTTSTGLSIIGGTGAVIGTGATIGISSGYYLPTNSDESTWNAKQNALTIGNFTTSTGIAVTGGVGSIIGTGIKIGIDSGYYLPTNSDKANWDAGGGVVAGDLTTSTGLLVTGGEDAVITSTGTKITIAPGFYLPTATDQSNWNQAYADSHLGFIPLWEINTDYIINQAVYRTSTGIVMVYIANTAHNSGLTFNITNWEQVTGGGGGSSATGSAFITNIVPTSTGTVSSKVFNSDGRVLESCLTDTQAITVSVLTLPGKSHYKPILTLTWGINSEEVTIAADSDQPLFEGSIAIILTDETILTITHEDGASTSVTLAYDAKPVIESANFINGYPGSQTELKLSDTFDINVVTDIPIIAIELDNYGAYSSQSFSVVSGTNHTVTGVIANRGTSIQNLGAKIRTQKSTGSWSSWHLTESDGSVDGTNLVKLNNIYPSISIGTITYPSGQGALKDSEEAQVANTVSNYDTILYSSPNGNLSIASDTTYASPKTVTRIAGTYNVVTNNLTITANRAANNATTASSGVVRIAHVACTLAVTEPATRLRSGGNDGTAAQNHTITITANQILYEAPTLTAGTEGIWQGGGFAGSGTTWTRSLQITDNMIKGTYSWGAISGKNLAGILTTAITGNADYILGGFVSRSITLDAYANEANMNVEAITYANVAMTWSVKALPNKRAVGTTAVPDANSWCLHTLSTNPTIIRILDTAATSASSVPTTITIQETV